MGAPQYLVLLSKKHPLAHINAGYMMQDVLLKLSDMNLDSCWLTFADSDDIKKDYEILIGELTQYNPELLDKNRILAITKCDMLDDELIEEMKAHLPEGIKSVFISSVAGLNIAKLKDMLWSALHE